jgi:aspartyl protease family protein
VLAFFVTDHADATNVQVQGLFKGSAVLTIDGTQRILKQGNTSPEGVKLLSATSKEAVLIIDGKRHRLGISQQISSGFQAAEKAELRIQAGHNGHFFTTGQINGRNVNFLVDTGASVIALNKQTAISLGINYRAGENGAVSTANGTVSVFIVNLDRVTVGGITVHNVRASVHLDESPTVALLGNSFLNEVNMSTENGVLLLSTDR